MTMSWVQIQQVSLTCLYKFSCFVEFNAPTMKEEYQNEREKKSEKK